MRLSKEEKECLRLLTRWSQAGRVSGECGEVIAGLGIDSSLYEPLMKKMEDIRAVYDVAQGMGQDYAEYFKIPASVLLQEILQMIMNGES